MRKKRFKTQEEFQSEVERRWLGKVRPPSRIGGVINTLIFVAVLAVLVVAAYRNRARIGALWQQMTGKTPPLQLTPVKSKH